MKNKLILFFLFFSLLLTPDCQADETWNNAARKVLSLSKQMDERSQTSKRFVNEDRSTLEKKIADLKKQINQDTGKLDQAVKILNQISAQRSALADQFEKETADLKTVEGSFKSAVSQTLSRFESSPVAAMYPENQQTLKTIIGQNDFPGPDQMKAYTSLLFSDIKATGNIETRSAKVVDADGRVRQMDLVRAGGFFLGCRDQDNAFFILPQAGGPGVSVKTPEDLGRHLLLWLKGKSEKLPLDMTAGTAIRALAQTQDVRSWVEAGGTLLYPILAAGLIGALGGSLKAFHLSFIRRLGSRTKQRLFDKAGTLDQIQGMLAKIKRCPAARVMEAGLGCRTGSVEVLDSLIEEKIMAEQGKQERFLSVIGVLASIAPLLGLLGTVTGMIDTFRAITVFGTSDPRMMSTGISEALVTTQAGLGIAVPLLLGHHFLKQRVALLVEDMETCGMGVIARLSQR